MRKTQHPFLTLHSTVTLTPHTIYRVIGVSAGIVLGGAFEIWFLFCISTLTWNDRMVCYGLFCFVSSILMHWAFDHQRVLDTFPQFRAVLCYTRVSYGWKIDAFVSRLHYQKTVRKPCGFLFPGEMGRRYTGNLAVESRWRFNSQKCRSVIGDSLRNLSKLEAWVGPAWLENLESAQTQNIWAQVCSRMPETFWPRLVGEVPVSAQEIPDYLSPRPRWLKICRHFGSQNFLSSSFAEIKNYCIFCRVLWQRQWFL